MQQSIQSSNAAKDAAKHLIQELTDYAPHTLLFGMCATFVLLGYLQYQFYQSVFNSSFVAIFIAAIVQLLRFAAGLTSANFFKMGRGFLAVMTMGLSLWLTYFESNEIGHISQAIADNFAADGYAQYRDAIEQVLRVVVWVGCVLELFLGLTLGSQASVKPATQEQVQDPAQEQAQVVTTTNVDQVQDQVQAMAAEIEFLRNQLAAPQQTTAEGNDKPTKQKKRIASELLKPSLSNGNGNGKHP
jgi:hypothetical protein